MLKFYFQTVEMTMAAHDTTGGMETKISEAAMIAKLGIDVYIVKVVTFFFIALYPSPFYTNFRFCGIEMLNKLQAATCHSLKALRGELRDHFPDSWLGTVVRFSR